MAPAVVRNRVRVDHGCAATGNHGPHPSLVVQDRELQRRARLPIHVADQRFLRVRGAAEGRRPVDLAPPLCAQESRRLVQLRSHVQGHHGVVFEHHQRIDLEVSKMEILVELVQAQNERGQVCLLPSWDLAQKLLRHQSFRGLHARRDLHPLRLRIHVTNIDTALVVEQDLVVVSQRVHADVELLLLLVRHHGLDEEVRQLPRDRFHLLLLAHALHDPILRLAEGLVHGNQAGLAAALDQLVRLRHHLLLLQPWVRLQNRVPRLALGFVQHVRGHQHTRIGIAVLAARILPEPPVQERLARVLADRLNRHGSTTWGDWMKLGSSS
mmetsp:Transcript_65824/g.170889  ORF Transcript_65824/g.170889 Transcript_65824/m.170889 type:complete len:325 (-) Transcript_65824:19-993(-)